MRYPSLIPKKLCKTPIYVSIVQEGISEDGAPLEAFTGELLCNYQDNGKTIWTAEQKLVQIAGIAFFHGDICPTVSLISGGEVQIGGEVRRILEGRKGRNPDGTVNYTELRLI